MSQPRPRARPSEAERSRAVPSGPERSRVAPEHPRAPQSTPVQSLPESPRPLCRQAPGRSLFLVVMINIRYR